MGIIAKITEGVKVSVESFYQDDYSSQLNKEHMFTYHIHIENHNAFPVQLLRRKWYIFDSNGDYKVIEGDGVVGRQPLLEPGQVHHYVSGVCLRTEIGRMDGYYIFERPDMEDHFQVRIPRFELFAPCKFN